MKKKSYRLINIASAAAALLTSGTLSAAPAPSSADPVQEKSDTLVYSATKSLIESFSELSKTASKLSETALKLLEAQKSIDERKESRPVQKGSQPVHEVEVTEQTEVTVRQTSQQPAHGSSFTEGPLTTIPVTSNSAGENNVATNGVYVSDETTSISSTRDLWIIPEETRGDGKYIWIPDSVMPRVESVLTGRLSVSIPGSPDLNETATWRGDTVLMALPTKRLGRYDRKLYNWLIYPRGLWHISLTANYGELSTDDSEFLSLIKDVDLKGTIYSIKPSVSFFLRNNLAIGMRLALTKGEMGINSFNVDIDEDMSFNLHDIKYTSESYSTALFIQQYFGLSRRGRFAVYNEAELAGGTGNTHFIRPFDGEMKDTRTKFQTVGLTYSPGISIMMMKNAAFNLSFGIFGFHLKSEKQWENGEESGSRVTSGINFRFNIFNINFGVSIII